MIPLTVGVLGGMGPAATLDFMQKVLEATDARRDQDGVRLLVDCNPLVPDRNAALRGEGPSPGPALADMARGLEAAGADFLVMACNTAHAFQYDIEQAVRVPFVSIIEETTAVVAELVPRGGAVGLLAAEGCLRAGLYQEAFARRGLAAVVPEPDDDTFMSALYAIKGGDLGPAVRRRMSDLAGRLVARGAQALVAACTEAPLVLAAGDVDAPLVDSTRVLARSTVAYARRLRPLPEVMSLTDGGEA
ncbi:aspartate/glutamate racemase family protein [Phenylobacterium sp.]|uniref:aspartate/glutamate racemase family protein n=1 Tax=Phenylobacterium sp. TaxID=1871053 RepID=UPI00391D9FEB